MRGIILIGLILLSLSAVADEAQTKNGHYVINVGKRCISNPELLCSVEVLMNGFYVIIYNEDGFEIYREIQQIDSEIDDCILCFDPSMRYGVESFVDEYMGMEVY